MAAPDNERSDKNRWNCACGTGFFYLLLYLGWNCCVVWYGGKYCGFLCSGNDKGDICLSAVSIPESYFCFPDRTVWGNRTVLKIWTMAGSVVISGSFSRCFSGCIVYFSRGVKKDRPGWERKIRETEKRVEQRWKNQITVSSGIKKAAGSTVWIFCTAACAPVTGSILAFLLQQKGNGGAAL